MSLQNIMRKAAGLLVEIPPEEASAAPGNLGGASPPGGKFAVRDEPDIDELLSAVRGPKAASGGGSSVVGAAAHASTATAAQLAQGGSGPNLDQIKSAAAGAVNPGGFVQGAPAAGAGPIVGSDGKLKVSVVYEAAGVSPTPFSAEQALELIQAMPADLPLEIRRQTVKATLSTIGKTLGATPQTIVADATRKAAALDAYLNAFGKKSEEFVGKVEGEIKTLEAQIAEKRKAIEVAKHRVEDLSKFCDREAERLDDVLEFFSLDVGPSKYAADAPPAGATPNAAPEPDKR